MPAGRLRDATVTTILIYGAAGFVGATLLANGLPAAKVICVDRRAPREFATAPPGIELSRIRSNAISELGIDADVLVVLAGQTDVDEALADPARAFETNMAIAVQAGEWWRQHPHARVVYMSSDEVLGESVTALDEAAPLRPTQPYAASKAAAEIAIRCYADAYGMDLVVVRSCNLVGGRQRARKLIPTAVECLGSRRPVPVFGDGTHKREYMAVEDLVQTLIMAIGYQLPAGVYNCTSGTALEITEVIETVAEALGVEPLSTPVAGRLIHDRAYAMDARLLQSYGWKPQIEARDAIMIAAQELEKARRRGEHLTGGGSSAV